MVGENNSRSIVSEKDVREIRGEYASGVTQARLAELYGVKAGAIQAITSRRNWGHVT